MFNNKNIKNRNNIKIINYNKQNCSKMGNNKEDS